MESKNYPGHFLSVQSNRWMLIEGYDHPVKVFKPGNTGNNGSISFLSVDTGWLSDNISDIRNALQEDTDSFKTSTTFLLSHNKWFQGYVAFESSARPGYYLKHMGLRVILDQFNNTIKFKEDASWKLMDRGEIFLNQYTFN